MIKFLFNLLMVAVLTSTTLQAQSEKAPNAFAVRHIINNYELPLDNFGLSDLDKFGKGLEFEYFRYLNKSFDLSIPVRLTSAHVPLSSSGLNTKQSGILGLDLMMNYNIYKGKVFRPRFFAGLGGSLVDMKEVDLNVPLGLGLNFYLGSNTSISTTFAYHLSNEDLRDHVQVGIGLRFSIEEQKETVPVKKDRDGDGIIDAEDLCPDDAGTIALNGCPDKDGDGITDASDKCPDTAGIAEFEGCPDTDSDGLMDSEDECPEEAGPADNKGCPVTDRDGDGVEDAKDNCPDEKGIIANNGCPERPLVISAKDKITGEVLPNTEVALLSNGQIVKTGTTNSFGIVEFSDVQAGDYTIEGKLYNVNLQPAQIKVSEFNSSEAVQKTIYYDDPNFILQGKVFYCNSTKTIPNVTLNLKNNADNFMKSTNSDVNGVFTLVLSNRTTYELYAKKESFLSQVVDVDANNYDRAKSVFVRLEVCAEEVKCGESIRLNNILYDSNSSFIREDAKADLTKVVQFMKDNTAAKIELSSHTDSKGRASYNLSLSEKRARAAADYIISQGIAASRVTGRGYGETRLLNNCADGVRCSASEHQINRRTEFKVVCPD